MNAGRLSRGNLSETGPRGSAGSTAGIGASLSVGPGHGFDQAPSASPSSLPSCSSRPLTEVSERPSRSTCARTVTGPVSGTRRKCMVAERALRSGSPTASSSARRTIAIT